MERRGCVASAISLFRLGVAPIDFAEHLLAQDVIYVTGGSMVNLMALWREHGLDEIMRAPIVRGIVLCGYSAGSMCWFEQGVSRGGGAPGRRRRARPASAAATASTTPRTRRAATPTAAWSAGEISGPGSRSTTTPAALIRDGELVETVRSREHRAAYRVDAGRRRRRRDRRSKSRLLEATAPAVEPGLAEMRELRRARAGSRRILEPRKG